MDTNDQDMLANLPLDLWAQGWELAPDETHIFEERKGSCHIVVYVRLYDRGLDVPDPKPGYVMRRERVPLIRVSTYGVCLQSWDEAMTAAISYMRAIDAQRQSAE